MTAGPYSIGSDHWPGLSKLIEECGEVLQVAGKLLGTGGSVEHWDDGGPLDVRLMDELADLTAAVSFFVDANGLSLTEFSHRFRRKLDLFNQWHEEQGS